MRYVNKIITAISLFLIVALNIVPNPVYAQLAQQQNVPGTFPNIQQQNKVSNAITASATGLQQFYSVTGHYTLSADGIGSLSASMNIRVKKPNAQAKVQKAILITSVTAFSNQTISNGCVTIAGAPVNWDGNAAVSFFKNYWADVTSIVSAQINSFPAGISTLPVTECNTGIIEGEALLVVFSDPTASEKTIVVMVGAQNPTGDNFSVTLAQAIDPNQSGALLDMGLGIGFGFQQNGGNQRSLITVNDQKLTSSAGGEDDGASSNGALITVGGIDDSNTNPVNPDAGPVNQRSDDELYSILPFITNTTTSLNINTINPSLDDNIFLAYFAISGIAVIGEGIILTQTESSGQVGTDHTVTASVLDTDGKPVSNRLVKFTVTSGPNAGKTFSANTNANGDVSFTYNGSGGAGTDNIQACFTNSQNEESCSNTLAFEWVTTDGGNIVSSFTLINANKDVDIKELKDGDVIDLFSLPAGILLNIRANTTPKTVGSVVFNLSGPLNRNQTENIEPYALFANDKGNYFGSTLPPGDYTLTATPYSGINGGGQKGTPLTIHFKVTYQASVNSFTLINAYTEKAISELKDGDVIYLSDYPAGTLFNIRANTSPSWVGSVVLNLSGAQTQNRTESGAPYTLYGDQSGNYWGSSFKEGNYTLTATPYSGYSGNGVKGTSKTISFSVWNSRPITSADASLKLNGSISATPNPSRGQTTISFKVPQSGYTTIELIDQNSMPLKRLYGAQAVAGQQYTLSFSKNELRSGVYFLRLTNGKNIQTYRLMLTE